MRARAILGDRAKVVLEAYGEFDLSTAESATEAILAIITRHPMAEEDLLETLDALSDLAESGEPRVIERYGKKFWSTATPVRGRRLGTPRSAIEASVTPAEEKNWHIDCVT